MPRDGRPRILVVGRDGQVARALRELPGEIADVVAIGRPEIDLATDLVPVARMAEIAPDIVVNAAAFTAVDAAEEMADLAERVNGRGAGLVAEAAARIGVPVVQLSTDYVFDGAAGRPCREDDPPAPLNRYGASKLAGEEAVRAATGAHVVLRTSWVYSAHGRNFVRTMLGLAAERDEIRVVDDQTGSPTAAADIALAIATIARRIVAGPDDTRLFGTFHFSGAGAVSWAGFAEEIFRLSAARGGPTARVVPITSTEFGAAARRPHRSVLDNGRIAAVYGIRQTDWHVALAAVIDDLVGHAGAARQEGTKGAS